MAYRVNIKRFPIDNRSTPTGNYLVIGRRGTGKTVFVDHLAEKFENVHEFAEYNGTDRDITLIVRDAEGFERETMNTVAKLLSNQKVESVIYESQYYPTLLVNKIRFDYIVLFGKINDTDKMRLYRTYGTPFHTYDLFSFTYDRCTIDYSCLIIKLHITHKSKIGDCVFCYKVPYDAKFQKASADIVPISTKKIYISDICVQNKGSECYHTVIFDGDYDGKELWPCSKIVDYILKDTTCTDGGLTVKQIQHFMPQMANKYKNVNIIDSYKEPAKTEEVPTQIEPIITTTTPQPTSSWFFGWF
jgi:hypothetical protein